MTLVNKSIMGLFALCVWVAPAHADEPAVETLKKACAKGWGSACEAAGDTYERGEGVARNPSLAAKFLNEACKLRIASACRHLAVAGKSGDLPISKEQVAELLLRACEGGEVLGCKSAGLQYITPSGIPIEREKALSLLRLACDFGDITSCDAGGFGLERLGESAQLRHEQYLILRCGEGWPTACYEIGHRHDLYGKHAEALRFFEKACSGGFGLGCHGAMLSAEKMSEPERARSFAEKACESGHADLCTLR